MKVVLILFPFTFSVHHYSTLMSKKNGAKNHTTVYPSICPFSVAGAYTSLSVTIVGGLEPNPAVTRRRRAATCTGCQFITGLTHRDKRPQSYIHLRQFRV